MHSFLEHLARTAPPVGGGGHDEQVRTWMKQVRELAHDCSNCIDIYLQHGDPAVYRARRGRCRCLWWASWLVHRVVAQHHAATRLRELKERARDVGERRIRYGVVVHDKAPLAAPSSSPPDQAADTEEEDDDDDDRNQMAAAAADSCDDHRRRLLEPRALDDYCAEKLLGWLKLQAETGRAAAAGLMPSIAIVAQGGADNAGAIARQSLDLAAVHFDRRVWINLRDVHHPWDLPLLPEEILCYILHRCQHQGTSDHVGGEYGRWQAYSYRSDVYNEIHTTIAQMKVDDKIEEIKGKIEQLESGKSNNLEKNKSSKTLNPITLSDKPLGILVEALRFAPMAPECKPLSSDEEIMQEAVEMLKEHMEAPAGKAAEPLIRLDNTQYELILQKMFPPASTKPPPQSEQAAASTLGEDHIREIVHNHKITLEIIRELLLPMRHLLDGNSVKEQTTCITKGEGANSVAAANEEAKEKMVDEDENKTRLLMEGITQDLLSKSSKLQLLQGNYVEEQTKQLGMGGHDKISNNAVVDAIKGTKDKMYEMSLEIKDQLFIKGIVDKIKDHLDNKKAVIVLQDEEEYVSQWEKTRNALSLLGCATGSAVIVATKNNQRAKEFCFPPGEPVTYSLVGLYHDRVLKLTNQRENQDDYNRQILRDILDKCDPQEFSMKMFMHALYANPNRSNEELCKLHEALQVPQNSLATSNAKKIFKFSYRDLPREHRTCLLHLAIFPPGHKIRRSTIIARWLTEGLITKEDWPTAVRHAERCFDALINRWLVWPSDIGAAGKVKSCMVCDPIHGFITKMAKKQHILDARLSDLWARHFSIFSGLRLRASDGIDKFVHKLPKYSPQLALLKVLDLENCQCFKKNHYLKDICNKILLLKYLSLRGTNVTHLPSEINNLHELEVLDIQQTKMPEHTTRDVMLLKLRRLLAGHVNQRHSHDMGMPIGDEMSLYSSVRIPRKIEKMENIEVLSNVKASWDGNELKDIRKLWRLRKFGVVIHDKDSHLDKLLRAISDLKECLQSLSITVYETKSEGISPNKQLLLPEMFGRLVQPPKLLESLSINGLTHRVRLLPLLARGSNELAKVTLSGTELKQNDLMVMAVLPNLCCVRFQHKAYTERTLTFKVDEFQHLKYFLVEGVNMTDIIFENGAAPELEHIILSFTNICSLCGIGCLPKLMELQLKGNNSILSLPQDRIAPDMNSESRLLTFKKGEFEQLKNFVVEGPNMTDIIFEKEAAPKLQKIVLSLTNVNSLSGVEGLPKLKEIELKGHKFLLSFFANANQITKVTLCDTLLKQEDMHILANKPNMGSLVLLDKSYDESQLAFNKDEFPKLNLLIVECSTIINISFADGSAPKLEKIVWHFSRKDFCLLSGIANLPEFKELEFNGDFVPDKVRKAINAHKRKPILTHKKPRHYRPAPKEEDEARFPWISNLFSKKQEDRR